MTNNVCRGSAFLGRASTTFGAAACWLLGAALLQTSPANAVEPNKEAIKALRPLDGLIGAWKGTGTSLVSSGWNETIECRWGFRERDGRVSINFYIDDGELLEVGLLTYNLEKKQYEFVGKDKKGKIIRFAGKPSGKQAIRLIRSDKSAGDKRDRIEIKLVRSGRKLIYAFGTRKGKSTFFDTYAQVELFLQGTPAAELKDAARCVVTGGLGRIAVEHGGKTYHVACESCKEEFLAHPERYVTRD